MLKWRLLNTWHAIFLGAWSVFWMTAAIVARVVTGSTETTLRWARTKWSTGLFWACGGRVPVDGLENVDFTKPHVFVTNHQSMIDIPVMFVALPVNLHFVAKKELMSVPFLGWYMKAAGMIPVDRRNGPKAIETLKKSAERVASGESVLAFAEGTRSRTGVIHGFKKGAFMLALQAQVPVVPCAIEGARKALPPDGFAVRPEVVRVRIGKPIPTEGKSAEYRDELMEQARAQVIEMNVSLGGLGGAPVAVEIGAHRRELRTAEIATNAEPESRDVRHELRRHA
jgi:1-acyl-sn-glycerol-3-phosphate acyltransferase